MLSACNVLEPRSIIITELQTCITWNVRPFYALNLLSSQGERSRAIRHVQDVQESVLWLVAFRTLYTLTSALLIGNISDSLRSLWGLGLICAVLYFTFPCVPKPRQY